MAISGGLRTAFPCDRRRIKKYIKAATAIAIGTPTPTPTPIATALFAFVVGGVKEVGAVDVSAGVDADVSTGVLLVAVVLEEELTPAVVLLEEVLA